MKLQVRHETVYDYAPAVKTAQHLAHLRPRDLGGQRLLHHSLVIDPLPAQRSELVDCWGNTRTFFSLLDMHDQLRVEADSLVTTSAVPEPASAMPWEEVRERMRYHRDAAYDPATEFVFASPHVPLHDDFQAYALTSFTRERPLLEAARELMERIHADFEYEPLATDVSTPALQAFEMRKGVCQDFAHIMLACLRALSLPARYVSGYVLTTPPPGQPRLLGADASHAWVSIYLPGSQPVAPQAGCSTGQWFDLDPTNKRSAGEDYVTLAVGRDYADVSPVRGVIHGGARHELRVAVTVTPLGTVAQ